MYRVFGIAKCVPFIDVFSFHGVQNEGLHRVHSAAHVLLTVSKCICTAIYIVVH